MDSLRAGVVATTARATSLEDAARRFARHLHSAFGAKVPLWRVFATVPFWALPAPRQSFARGLAGSSPLAADALVLSLMGTAGERPSWNDPAESAQHLAIPLENGARVESMPMISAMFRELGVVLVRGDGVGRAVRSPKTDVEGAIFHVADAGRAADAIPCREFVQTHAIQSVFALTEQTNVGGHFIFLTSFASYAVDRAQAAKLKPVVTSFRLSASALIRAGRLFG